MTAGDVWKCLMDVGEVLERGKEGGEVKRLFFSEGERMRGTGSRVSGARDCG